MTVDGGKLLGRGHFIIAIDSDGAIINGRALPRNRIVAGEEPKIHTLDEANAIARELHARHPDVDFRVYWTSDETELRS